MFSTFKQRLADRAVSVLVPIQDEMRRLMDDTACIDAVLHDGAERARVISRPILEKIYDVVGFLRP
jgi:tryptophanyl-tRNA synthetase